MGCIENQWRSSMSRRRALVGLAGMVAASPLLHAQRDPRPLNLHRRVPSFDEMRTPFDFEDVFSRNLPQWVVDYTDHGAESEWNMRRNREAFDWVDIVKRPETEVTAGGTATEILGTPMNFPILVAPTAAQGPLHPDGEMGMHVGATNANATIFEDNASLAAAMPEIGQPASGHPYR